MGAWYSKPKAPSSEASNIHFHSPLTRLRILPQPNLPPVVQDVYLPTDALASLDSLFAFINTLSIVKMLPDHELAVDYVHLLRKDDLTPDTFVTKSNGSDALFRTRMDRIWMTNERCVIIVPARPKADAMKTAIEKEIDSKGVSLRSVAKEEKETEGDGHGVEDGDDRLYKEGKAKVVNVPAEDIGEVTKGEKAFLGGEGNGKRTEEAAQGTEEQMAEGTDRAEGEQQHQKSNLLWDSPLSQKHLYDPELPPGERVRLQAHSPPLPEYQSQQLKKQQEEFEPRKGASSGAILESSAKSELPTQSKAPLSPAAGSVVYDEDARKREEKKAKLQRDLQSKMTQSLSSRGKPTSSKSPTYKNSTASDPSSEAIVPPAKPSSAAFEKDKASANRLGDPHGGVLIPKDTRQP